MALKKILTKLFKPVQTKVIEQPKLSRERIAQHEAAHGIVWYLFKNNWTVKKLTIEHDELPDEGMDGALHISPSFDVKRQYTIDKDKELSTIALAGLIGQNMNLLLQNPNLVIDLMQVNHYNKILDETGCGGDYEIAVNHLSRLAKAFQKSKGYITRYIVLDLVTLFQKDKITDIHTQLTQLLLEKGTLSREDLITFFEGNNFQEYIEEENLDINFFHNFNTQ